MPENRMGAFIQHMLSADQLSAGLLAVIDPVEIPDEPLAMMALRVRFAPGFSVTLKEHPRAPVEGGRDLHGTCGRALGQAG
jgi:hypothetical protein